MARKKQTLLILLGISLGTLLFVSISGVQLGMRAYISEQLLNNTAHILITGSEHDINPTEVTEAIYGESPALIWTKPPAGKREETKLQHYQGWVDFLKANTEVLDFSPRLSTNALLVNGKFSASINLMGVIPERHARLTQVEHYMREGEFAKLKSRGNNIVIGSGVAKKLGLRVHQIVNVTSGKSQTKPYRVSGIVHYGNQQFDDAIAYAHLDNVQTLTRMPGQVSAIAVALFDIDRSLALAETWKNMSRDKVEDWQSANKAFLEVIRVQDFTRYFITTAILIVAAFGIYNVLTIMISQKRKEIAILRAIGYAPRRILELILYQGILLGLAGGFLGLLLGYLLCIWFGSIDFGFEIGGSNHLRISYELSIYITAFLTANIASLIASYIPAWEASRMTPMDIIRSES